MSGRRGGRLTSTTTTGKRAATGTTTAPTAKLSGLAAAVRDLDTHTLTEAETALRTAGLLDDAISTRPDEERRAAIADAVAAATGRIPIGDRVEERPGILDVIGYLTHRFCGEDDAPVGGGGLGPRSFGAPSGRWTRGNLAIGINTAGCTLPPQVVVNTIMAAFGAYAAAEPFFSFTQAGGNAADITVQFGGANLDGRLAQGRGGALGIGGPPPRGNLFLLADVGLPAQAGGAAPFAWTQGLLAAIALHEAGHVLGLSHSTDPNAVMYPFAPNLVALDAETRRAINSLYGWSPQRPLTDRASSLGPSLAIVSTANFTSRTDRVFMAWKGTEGDTAIYWSESPDGIGWGGQQRTAFGSTTGPSIAAYTPPGRDPTAMMAWKGVRGDTTIYTSVLGGDGQWSPQDVVPNVGTSERPALVEFNGRMVMAWKGVDGDSGIYWSTLDPGGWRAQAPIAGRGTSNGPSLVLHQGQLRMFWKGIPGDSNVFQATLVDPGNGIWGPQSMVTYIDAGNLASGQQRFAIGSSDAPTAISRGDELLLIWKGVEGDSTLWFARTDAAGEFSGQVPIANTGTAGRPGIVSVGGRIIAAWRGVEGDTGLYTANLG